jgi:hypothetical protein
MLSANNRIVEFRPTGMSCIYYKYRNVRKTYPWNTPDSIGTLILSSSIIILHPISYFLFYWWRSREWLTLSSVLEIVHYYNECPFTIFFSGPSCRMVVGFTTTCAINALPFTTYVVSSNSCFLRILRFPPQIKLYLLLLTAFNMLKIMSEVVLLLPTIDGQVEDYVKVGIILLTISGQVEQYIRYL